MGASLVVPNRSGPRRRLNVLTDGETLVECVDQLDPDVIVPVVDLHGMDI
jgi:hypothetical protein